MATVLNCMHLGIGPHGSRSVLVMTTVISSLRAEGKLCRHIKASAVIQSLYDGYCMLVRVFFLTVVCTQDHWFHGGVTRAIA